MFLRSLRSALPLRGTAPVGTTSLSAERPEPRSPSSKPLGAVVIANALEQVRAESRGRARRVCPSCSFPTRSRARRGDDPPAHGGGDHGGNPEVATALRRRGQTSQPSVLWKKRSETIFPSRQRRTVAWFHVARKPLVNVRSCDHSENEMSSPATEATSENS